MTSATRVATQLLLHTTDGVTSVSDSASSGKLEARTLLDYPQRGQRLWGGFCLAADADGTTIYAGGGDGVRRSQDGGRTWQNTGEALKGRDVRGAGGAPWTRPGRLLVGTAEIPPVWMEHTIPAPQIAPAGAQLVESLDNGKSWRQVTGGFPERNEHILSGIAQHPDDGDRWYVVTVGGDLYESDDGGDSWRLALSELPGILDVCLRPGG